MSHPGSESTRSTHSSTHISSVDAEFMFKNITERKETYYCNFHQKSNCMEHQLLIHLQDEELATDHCWQAKCSLVGQTGAKRSSGPRDYAKC